MGVCQLVLMKCNTFVQLLLIGGKNYLKTFLMAALHCFHQLRGFKGGMSIASLHINGIHSHLDEIKLL